MTCEPFAKGDLQILVVVDTSFVLALALPEKRSRQVTEAWEGWISAKEEIVAPSLLAYEIAGVLRNKVQRGLMSQVDARKALELLLALPIELLRPAGLHMLAFSAAEALSLPTAYDCHFLALAEQLGIDLWTLDEQFHRKASTRYAAVYTISSSMGPA